MGVLMLVADGEAGEPVIGPSVAERLARLGITRIALLREGKSVGVVLEGWAFSSSSTDEAAQAVFPTGVTSVRAFTEVESVVVSALHDKGEADGQ